MRFVFFMHKTAYDMSISDWSSDVCSSNLMGRVVGQAELPHHRQPLRGKGLVQFDHVQVADLQAQPIEQILGPGRRPNAHEPGRNASDRAAEKIGRATWRATEGHYGQLAVPSGVLTKKIPSDMTTTY